MAKRLRTPVLVLFTLSYSIHALATPTTKCLFCVSIDESPAPPPDQGPPFSAHASRNRALLPAQICGIIGAYIGAILILGTLLITVGRRLRRQALTRVFKPVEMVKPANRTFDPSPLSPADSQRSWYSPQRLGKKKSAKGSIRSGHPTSPGGTSVVSFDTAVIEADKAKRQEEMERLYAAVMSHDDRKSLSRLEQVALEAQRQEQQSLHQRQLGEPPQYSRKAPAPPRLITSAPGLAHLRIPNSNPTSPRSPITPKSPVRAIYPPGVDVTSMPMSSTGSIRADYPHTPLTPGDQYLKQPQSPLRTNRDSRASSFGSPGSATGDTSHYHKRKARNGIRNLRISAPSIVDDNSDGARTPLSPRIYTDPGIPPEPPVSARTNNEIDFADSDNYSPATLGTARSWRYGYDDDQRGHANEDLQSAQYLPHPAPQRLSRHLYNNSAQQLTDMASTQAEPTVSSSSRMTPPYQVHQQSQSSPSNPLPLRNYMPHFQHAPFSPGFNTKTTYLSHRPDMLSAVPRTGGLATPYSPYMPFTPLTPVTPHLTSRVERKAREREERSIMGALGEEDGVQEEGEIWASGY